MIHVTSPRHTVQQRVDRLAATIRVGQHDHEVWFAAPAPIATTADPFFSVALPVSMKLRQPMHLEAAISPRLQSQVVTLQSRFAAHDSALTPVPVTFAAPRSSASSSAADDRGVGVFFSGGVDSFHTLLTLRDQITHLVFVHGFDIPINDTASGEAALRSVREVAAALNKRLIVVETNLRQFGDPLVNWGYHLFGAAAAAVSHLLSPQLRAIYIAGEKLDPGEPVGSRADLDSLWATEDVSLIHHGDDISRFGKLKAMAGEPLMRQHLRVCWQNVTAKRNCGRCSKCLRNMAALRALGVLDQCSAFSMPLDLRALACLELPAKWQHVEGVLREVIDHAQAHGRDPQLVAALCDCVERRYHGGLVNALRWRYWRICHALRLRGDGRRNPPA